VEKEDRSGKSEEGSPKWEDGRGKIEGLTPKACWLTTNYTD